MRYRPLCTLGAVVMAASGFGMPASAQQEDFPCDAFVKNADGSWSVTRATYIPDANSSVRVGARFTPGEPVRGFDLVGKLNDTCRGPLPVPPPAAAVPAAPPRETLTQFADANGNLDMAHLACSHIAGTPSQDVELLLAWFSAASTKPAGRYVVNVARLHYAARNLLEYCRTNRDQSLIEAMKAVLR